MLKPAGSRSKLGFGSHARTAILDRHPQVLSQALDVSDLFGASGMEWLKQIELPGEDNRVLASELELLEVLKRKISESNGPVKCATSPWRPPIPKRGIQGMRGLHEA